MSRAEKITIPFIMVLTLLLMSGCTAPKRATFLEATYDGLAISQLTYKQVLEGFAQAQIDGQINDTQMDNVLRIARGYQNTHNLIVTLLTQYSALTDPASKSDVQTRITGLTGSVNGIMLELISLLGTYGVSI